MSILLPSPPLFSLLLIQFFLYITQLFSEYSHLIKEAIGVQSEISSEQNVLVIQPYVKFGEHKSHVPPKVRLAEANDLIRSLDTWSIIESIKVPLNAFGKQMLFGTGKIDELRALVKKYNGDPKRKVQFKVFFLRHIFSENCNILNKTPFRPFRSVAFS